ncbi:MAG TPA: hypothetical protein VGL70_03150 [Candidatus Binatia bacterium]|jgi:hypothetical protein
MTVVNNRHLALEGFVLLLILAAFAEWFIVPVRAQALKLDQPAPDIAAGSRMTWINSAPLTMAGLKGRVVLVEFWTYG